MEFDAYRPVWNQIADILRERIGNGVYRRGQPIPSESQLVGEFGIARGTARKVVDHLRQEGLVFTVPRLGTFVGPPGSVEDDPAEPDRPPVTDDDGPG